MYIHELEIFKTSLLLPKWFALARKGVCIFILNKINHPLVVLGCSLHLLLVKRIGQRVSLPLVSKADDRHLCLQQGQELLKPSESEGNEYGVCGAKETSNIAGFGCVSHSLSASRLRSLNFSHHVQLQ